MRGSPSLSQRHLPCRSGVFPPAPTGGYCLTPTKRNVGGNYFLPKHLAAELGAQFAGSSVLDLGCGIGQYGTYFAMHHPAVRWTGVDGAERVEESTAGKASRAACCPSGHLTSPRAPTRDHPRSPRRCAVLRCSLPT